MITPLDILIVEDSKADAEMLVRELRRGGFELNWQRVDNARDLMAALAQKKVQLVLSDYTLPGFDGESALKTCREMSPEVPFIFVSGSMGEERAIESLQSGATDYVLKDRLARLVPAVRRAMREIEQCAARKRVEEQYIQAQKMEVVGNLAGSVAHDFNNILSVILGYNECILDQLGASHPSRAYALEVKLAAQQAVGLTRQLLTFSRKHAFQPVVLNLNDVVSEMENMLKRLFDENVELKIVATEDLWLVEADAGYLGQIVLNLVVNARDAMPQGGKLTIETSNAKLDEDSAPMLTGPPPGAYVVLTVRDTGVGMTDAVKARMFEPFFTTKPSGKGTGLGLCICQTIVKQCAGHIVFHSRVDHGTTFKVFLPRCKQAAALVAAPASPGPLPRGTETLLFVEDDPSIRRLSVQVLQSLGYEVLSASNGHDGWRAAQQHTGMPIRLAITDVVMPRMGGKAMADWLKASFPDIKILFTSGYPDSTIAHHGVLEAQVELIPKPYTPSALAYKVREILERGIDGHQ
jgi:two-component system, cell cycle sensor histidine kinase and response regulator CckA